MSNYRKVQLVQTRRTCLRMFCNTFFRVQQLGTVLKTYDTVAKEYTTVSQNYSFTLLHKLWGQLSDMLFETPRLRFIADIPID